jgi:hypothetical protein
VHRAAMAFRRDRLLWTAVVCMLVLGLLSIGYLVWMELGPWRHEVIEYDEMYFASCAARGMAVGQLPVAGCYDNKGPMISFVYQLVQIASSRYDIVAIKGAAFAVVALVTGLVAMLAHRLGGKIAAVAAAALALQSFATEVSHMALKTETVGVAFLLAGLIVLVSYGQGDRAWSRLLSGCLVGLAAVTKQTNLLVGLAVLVWFGLCWRGPGTEGSRTFIKEIALFSMGLMVPFLLFLLLFGATGRQAEFLGSFLLYPSIYGAHNDIPAFKLFLLKLGSVLRTLGKTPLLAALFAMSLARLFLLSAGNFNGRMGAACSSRILVGLAAIALLLVTVISPVFFSYHVVPSRTLMAVLGGTLIADMSAKFRASSSVGSATVAIGLVSASLLMAAISWYRDGGKNLNLAFIHTASVGDSAGDYGYVLGTSPHFYFVNGLVPASNVMFPWALAGAPEIHYYTLPSIASRHGLVLAEARARGLQDLMADFRRTPPRYIFVVDKFARSAKSPRLADIPGFDEYVADRCQHLRKVSADWRGSANIFRCRTNNEMHPPEGTKGFP